MTNTTELREALLTPIIPKIDPSKLLSTGSTLLNLALSKHWNGGLLPGTYYWLCGDSDSGKSWLTHSILAEAANNPVFDDYTLIYDDAENGALMDIEQFFGQKLATRCEPPTRDKEGNPVYSSLVEEFYSYVDNLTKAEKKFIYVLDSMDALDCIASEKLFEHNKEVIQANLGNTTAAASKLKDSYNMNKAKYNSQNIRRLMSRLRSTGSILIVVTQTRDNVSGFGAPTVAGGGKALKFYSHAQIWTKPAGVLKKTINKIERHVGVTCDVNIKKNRLTGQHCNVQFNIHNTYGIDDLGSCIDYLIMEGVVNSSAKKSVAMNIPQMDLTGTKEKIIMDIEEANRENELRQLVHNTWNDILTKTTLHRKKRYE
jgi:RecA/RadA recombinase